jgi:hypothetical protein
VLADESKQSKEAPPLGRVVAKSVMSPLNLAIAGSSAVAAAAMHLWPIAAVGGVAYAALVAWDVFNPTFWKKALAREPTELPDAKSVSDPASRAAVEALRKAQTELESVLAETSDEVKGHLGVALASVAELEDRAVHLIERAEALARYLARTDAEPVRVEMRKLADKVQRTRDPQARAQYESALATRGEQLKALEDIADAKERVSANLSRIVATVEGLPAKIVRMRVLDAQAMDELSGTMNDELGRINGEMQAFEETLKSLVEIANA